MERNHSIELADGTKLENLSLNGTNYISDKEVDPAIFSIRNLSRVIFSDGEITEEREHMALVHVLAMDGNWWIAFREITDEELKDRQVRADIDYIAMMTDVEL